MRRSTAEQCVSPPGSVARLVRRSWQAQDVFVCFMADSRLFGRWEQEQHMLIERLADQLDKFWGVFYLRIVAPCYLPKPADLQDEQVKINFLRIVLGAAVVW